MEILSVLAMKYLPYIYFDKNEPFFPIRVGYTVINCECQSASFGRWIEFYDESMQYVIEYAVYWDFDIEHLYELEHIWVFVDKNGEVCECESSFHGDYFRSLLKDRSNIEDGTHVRVYSQPGKHAFFPKAELFDLLPDLYLYSPMWENAGSGGLLCADIFNGLIKTDSKTDKMVEQYLKNFKFIPSMEFEKHVIDVSLLVTWEDLYKEIPQLVNAKLKEIENEVCNDTGK